MCGGRLNQCSGLSGGQMDIKKISESFIGRLNPRVATWIYNRIKNLPSVRKKIEQEYEAIINDLEHAVKPYREKFTSYAEMPEVGCDKAKILKEMQAITGLEEAKWKEGYASGAVYHGDEAHIHFLNQVYALNSQSNPLHSDTNLRWYP
jgi:sphinganine-1-phosphate aldolase